MINALSRPGADQPGLGGETNHVKHNTHGRYDVTTFRKTSVAGALTVWRHGIAYVNRLPFARFRTCRNELLTFNSHKTPVIHQILTISHWIHEDKSWKIRQANFQTRQVVVCVWIDRVNTPTLCQVGFFPHYERFGNEPAGEYREQDQDGPTDVPAVDLFNTGLHTSCYTHNDIIWFSVVQTMGWKDN